MFDTLIHKILGVTYKLHIASDTGKGQPVIFLHGLASDSSTWRNVLPNMDIGVYRCITIDLLGFGESPKPDWQKYDTNDHVKAIAKTISALHLSKPPIIVGHSMGSLIAVSLAARHPKLVKSLVLCSMPVYQNSEFDSTIDAYKKTGRNISNAYFNVYEGLINRKDLTLDAAKKIVKVAGNETSFMLNESTWLPFKNSLEFTIKGQHTIAELEKLQIPIAILYGRFDVFVLGGYFRALAKTHSNITVYTLNSRHEITPNYAKKVAQTIQA